MFMEQCCLGMYASIYTLCVVTVKYNIALGNKISKHLEGPEELDETSLSLYISLISCDSNLFTS